MLFPQSNVSKVWLLILFGVDSLYILIWSILGAHILVGV